MNEWMNEYIVSVRAIAVLNFKTTTMYMKAVTVNEKEAASFWRVGVASTR